MAIFSPRYRSIFSIFLVLVVTFLFFSHSLKHPQKFPQVGKGVFSLVCYFQKTVQAIVSFPVQVWKQYVFLVKTEEKNQRLTNEIKKLRQENVLLQEAAIANRRFKRLLGFKENAPWKLLAAEVVGVDASSYFESFCINKGGADGVKRGMAVLSPDGVVGKIFKVADSFSVVLLLVDQSFALDVLVQRTRTRGVVVGLDGNRCQMKYVLQSEDIRAGDFVIASGLEGFFPKGAVVGRVASIKKDQLSPLQDVFVQPLVDFKKTEEVFVILARKP